MISVAQSYALIKRSNSAKMGTTYLMGLGQPLKISQGKGTFSFLTQTAAKGSFFGTASATWLALNQRGHVRLSGQRGGIRFYSSLFLSLPLSQA